MIKEISVFKYMHDVKLRQENHLILGTTDYDRRFIISEGNIAVNTIDFWCYKFSQVWESFCKYFYWGIRKYLNNNLEFISPLKRSPRNPIKLLYLFGLNSGIPMDNPSDEYLSKFRD